MYKKYDDQFIVMQATIEANRQEIKANNKYSDEKMLKLAEDFKSMITSTITSIMDLINISKSSLAHKDSPKLQ